MFLKDEMMPINGRELIEKKKPNILNRQKLHNKAEKAIFRNNMYKFLTEAWGEKPTVSLIQQVRDRQFRLTLMRLGMILDPQIRFEAEKDLCWKLKKEYARLFLGQKPPLVPREPDYYSPGGIKKETDKIKALLLKYGDIGSSKSDDLENYIGFELKLMQKLTEKEKDAWQKDDPELVKTWLEYERKFILEYFGLWVPKFCDRVFQQSSNFFYQQLAAVTKKFIAEEQQRLKNFMGLLIIIGKHFL